MEEFLKHFGVDGYEGEIKDFDYTSIKGAAIYGDHLRIYQLCCFLGIRVVGILSNYEITTENIISELSDEACTNIIIIDKEDINNNIDIEYVKEYAESLNKLVYIYELDSKLEFLHKVNVLRSDNKNFC